MSTSSTISMPPRPRPIAPGPWHTWLMPVMPREQLETIARVVQVDPFTCMTMGTTRAATIPSAVRSCIAWDEAVCVQVRHRAVHTVMGQQTAGIASACSVLRLHSRAIVADDTIDALTEHQL